MYTDINFQTKKALKEAVTAGKEVRYHQPGLGTCNMEGSITVSGPHYPKPHKWYAECKVSGGIITSVK